MILTLTTDFGTRDGYVAQMKGVVLGINPRAVLVDATHEIEPFSVLEAAFVVRGMAPYYPPGTVHVAVVDPGVGSERRGIVVQTAEGLFVGPDNGVFSFILAGARSTGTARQGTRCGGHRCGVKTTGRMPVPPGKPRLQVILPASFHTLDADGYGKVVGAGVSAGPPSGGTEVCGRECTFPRWATEPTQGNTWRVRSPI